MATVFLRLPRRIIGGRSRGARRTRNGDIGGHCVRLVNRSVQQSYIQRCKRIRPAFGAGQLEDGRCISKALVISALKESNDEEAEIGRVSASGISISYSAPSRFPLSLVQST